MDGEYQLAERATVQTRDNAARRAGALLLVTAQPP